ncbi:hypothetical protein BSKO_02727 [Bryopsis sp. KO-2023]|nr:hypothetical protein BSKO_02727 [Bryopsis sp. KO-2023]
MGKRIIHWRKSLNSSQSRGVEIYARQMRKAARREWQLPGSWHQLWILQTLNVLHLHHSMLCVRPDICSLIVEELSRTWATLENPPSINCDRGCIAHSSSRSICNLGPILVRDLCPGAATEGDRGLDLRPDIEDHVPDPGPDAGDGHTPMTDAKDETDAGEPSVWDGQSGLKFWLGFANQETF